jgi:hypothetical protein
VRFDAAGQPDQFGDLRCVQHRGAALPAATVRSCVPPDVGTVRTVFSATAICLTVPVALSAVM